VFYFKIVLLTTFYTWLIRGGAFAIFVMVKVKRSMLFFFFIPTLIFAEQLRELRTRRRYLLDYYIEEKESINYFLVVADHMDRLFLIWRVLQRRKTLICPVRFLSSTDEVATC
jgi:hypothetical protein